MQVLIQGNQVAIVAKFLLGKWQETLREIGTIFGCSDFRDRLGWQALLMIGRWYLLPPTQWFLGELVFHPSPQTPVQPKTRFLSHCFICVVSDQWTVVK